MILGIRFNSVRNSFGAVAAVVVAVTATAMALAPAAIAGTPPYTDQAAQGRITLCDVTGASITHGSIHTKPFIWRAVGSQSGQGVYRSNPRRTAALFAFRPVKGVDAFQWNGEYLTASAKYTNAALPMAGAVASDKSLADFMRDYPLEWNGLIQLRMYLGAPFAPTKTDTYNASSIQVRGDTWMLLDGGSSPCNSGTATSDELVLPQVAKLGTPKPNATTTGAGATAARGGAVTPGSTSGTGNDPSALTAGVRSAAQTSHASSNAAWLWIVGAVAAAGLGYAGWRRFGRVHRRA